jgi:hypothetical protein
MPDYVTPMMITQAIVLGCLFLGLIMQVLIHAAISKVERVLLTNQCKILAEVTKINRKTPEPVEHWIDSPPLTDEEVLAYIRNSGEMEAPLPLEPDWRVSDGNS